MSKNNNLPKVEIFENSSINDPGRLASIANVLDAVNGGIEYGRSIQTKVVLSLRQVLILLTTHIMEAWAGKEEVDLAPFIEKIRPVLLEKIGKKDKASQIIGGLVNTGLTMTLALFKEQQYENALKEANSIKSNYLKDMDLSQTVTLETRITPTEMQQLYLEEDTDLFNQDMSVQLALQMKKVSREIERARESGNVKRLHYMTHLQKELEKTFKDLEQISVQEYIMSEQLHCDICKKNIN